jgi:hypothetical protein
MVPDKILSKKKTNLGHENEAMVLEKETIIWQTNRIAHQFSFSHFPGHFPKQITRKITSEQVYLHSHNCVC